MISNALSSKFSLLGCSSIMAGNANESSGAFLNWNTNRNASRTPLFWGSAGTG